jgi:hypothetical protein
LLVAAGLFKYYFCYALLLFDVLNFSEILKDVVRSVVKPIHSLLLTFWLFMITMFVYTAVGMWFFGDMYVVEDSDGGEINPCQDMLHCFVAFSFSGLVSPEEQDMSSVTYKNGTIW